MEIHPGTPNIYFTKKIAKGDDTKPIFDKADVVVEDDFYVGRQPHMPMEPDVGFAFLMTRTTICTSTPRSIGLHLHAAMIAPGLGVELENW
jgi:aldehyde oxidoreductase